MLYEIVQTDKDDIKMYQSIMGYKSSTSNSNSSSDINSNAHDASDSFDDNSSKPAPLLALIDDAVSGCIIVTGTHASGKREVKLAYRTMYTFIYVYIYVCVYVCLYCVLKPQFLQFI